MKELKFNQNSAYGEVKGVLRIVKNILYFKLNNDTYSKQIMEQMKQKGAIVNISNDKKWIRVDIFKDNDLIKLGESELDLKESTDEEIEDFLIRFYKNAYERQGFYVEVS